MSFKVIQLKSDTKRVSIESVHDTRSSEQKKKEVEEKYFRINSYINPFVSKIDILRGDLDYVYLYLSFDDYISTDEVQKCIKKISGEDNPDYQMVSEDEMSIILKAKPSKINQQTLKHQGKYVSYLSRLKNPPTILKSTNYSEAYAELESIEFKDDFDTAHVVIVLKHLDQMSIYIRKLEESDLFKSLSPLPELGVIFGVLKDSKNVKLVREYKFVACAYLKDFFNIAEYAGTSGKTDVSLNVSYNKEKLKNKPAICVIDCGVSKAFNVLKEKKLDYLGSSLLDHGTQIASIATCAKSILSNNTQLLQEYNLFSFKMCDGKKENILEGIVNAIKEFKDDCKIFVLSYNFYDRLEPMLLHYISKRLDYFLHKSNVILLAPTGNNAEPTIKDAIDYNYLDKNPILFPSNAKNVFSVGGLEKYDNPKRVIASYTRFLPYFPDLEHRGEAYFILKPNMYVFGGGSTSDQKDLIRSMSADKKLVKTYGTSFANALSGYFFARLMEEFPRIKNTETYKAIMLASGTLTFVDKRKEANFKIALSSLREFEEDIKHILLYDEHNEKLNKYRPKRILKLGQNAEQLKFYVNAEKIEKVQVFLVHSNDCVKNPYNKSLIYFNVRLFPPNQKRPNSKYSSFGDKSKWSTFGKCTPVQVAEYNLGKQKRTFLSQTGDWTLQIMPKRKNVPVNEDVNIRWGIVIKLIPRSEYLDSADEIYEEILNKMAPEGTKIKFLEESKQVEQEI